MPVGRMTFGMASSRNRRRGRRVAVPLVVLALVSVLPLRAAASVERGLGRQVAQQLEEEIGVVSDPALALWVERIGTAIVRADGGDPRRFSFKILDSDDVNAFALPGGFVYVTSGLLRFVESEDELACVLGHEIAHVVLHHSTKQLQRDLLLSLALTLLRAHLPETVSTISEMGGVLYTLRHSRNDEVEADALGLQKAARAGFDACAMLGFLRKLAEKEGRKPSRFEIYFMTHPPTGVRLEKAKARPEADPSNADARAMAAGGLAARGLYRQGAVRYEEALARQPNNAALHLAAAACWEALGQHERAREERQRARALGLSVADPPPAAPSARPPLAEHSAVVAALAQVKKAQQNLAFGRESRERTLDAVRQGLDSRKRQFRQILITLNTAAGSLGTADLVRQQMLRRIGVAVARLEKAIGRVDGIAEAAHAVPVALDETGKTLTTHLTVECADAELVEIAGAYGPIATQALADLDQSVGDCGKALRRIDDALRACHVAAQDLAESALVPARFLLIRYGQIDSRIDAAASGATSAARAADDAGLLADAAEAHSRILALDLLGWQTPRPQRPAFYALLVHRFGLPEEQTMALARQGAPLGRSVASLLLSLSSRVPPKDGAITPPARNESHGTPKDPPTVANECLVSRAAIEEAVQQRVPLAPLNVALRILGLDLARENEAVDLR